MYSAKTFQDWLHGGDADERQLATCDELNRDCLEPILDDSKATAAITCKTVFPLMYTSLALNTRARLNQFGIETVAETVLDLANGHILLGVLDGLEERVSSEALAMALAQAKTLLGQVEHALSEAARVSPHGYACFYRH
jgi:hypothetical protein